MRAPVTYALTLSLLSAVGCAKHRGSKAPENESKQELVGYGDLAWTESNPSPSIQPIEVCQHLAQLVARENGSNPNDVDPQLLAECEADLALEASARGTDNWNAIAGCVLRAQTGADIDECDRANPMPGGAGPALEPEPEFEVTQREVDACTHMIAVMIAEDSAASGEPSALSGDEQMMLVQFCAQALAEQQTRGPAEYDRMLQCIGSAQTQADLQVCESN